MKLVHTFWSCHKPDLTALLAHKAGWSNATYHYMSWMLSCLLARQYYDIELVTDSMGKTLLVDELQLPYTNVRVVLDDRMAGQPDHLWALPKIISYSIQDEPFVHIDGDVFLFKPLGHRAETAAVVAQNVEVNFPIYHEAMEGIEQYFPYIPESIKIDRKTSSYILASNTGSFGGNDIEFIQYYARQAMHFVEANRTAIHHAHPVYINCIFEQYLLHCLSKQANTPITYLFDDIFTFNEYLPIAKFSGVPTALGYVHPVGPFKQHPLGCKGVARRLRIDYPHYYHRLLKLMNHQSIQGYIYKMCSRLTRIGDWKKAT